MRKNIFFIIMFATSMLSASEVQQFFYVIKVATIATIIALRVQPVWSDTIQDKNIPNFSIQDSTANHEMISYKNDILAMPSFCSEVLCKPDTKSYLLVEPTFTSQFLDQTNTNDLRCNKNSDSMDTTAALDSKQPVIICPADKQGSYNPGDKGYLLK